MSIGHPTTYKPEHCETIKKLIAIGAKDTEIADFFGVCVATIFNWRYKYPEFNESSKTSKEQYDSRVVRSLNERALGYSCLESKVFNVDGELVEKTFTKHYPPDTAACIFWLKNRQPEMWRDVRQQEITGKIERDDIDDLDLARKLVYLLQKGEKQLETQH